MFALIVGGTIVPSQAVDAVIVVSVGICTFTGVVEIDVVTSKSIAGTVAILLSHDVVNNGATFITASVTSAGIVTVVATSLEITTSDCPVLTSTSHDHSI